MRTPDEQLQDAEKIIRTARAFKDLVPESTVEFLSDIIDRATRLKLDAEEQIKQQRDNPPQKQRPGSMVEITIAMRE